METPGEGCADIPEAGTGIFILLFSRYMHVHKSRCTPRVDILFSSTEQVLCSQLLSHLSGGLSERVSQWIYANVCGGQRLTPVFLSSLIVLVWLVTDESQGSACLCDPFQISGAVDPCNHMHDFLHGCWASRPGPHACAAGIVQAKPSPRQ